MPLIRILPGGTSGGFPGLTQQDRAHVPPRGDVVGWSQGASRRLVAALWSVDSNALPAAGWAVTLTTGGTPESADDWHAARRALMKRLDRLGVTLQQWVIEWTAKGRPHLHMAIYGDDPKLERAVYLAWLEVCDSHGWPATTKAQHVVKINDVNGWLQYVSKHAARGVNHYQRQGCPEGWTRTGRLWGFWGDWPYTEAEEFPLTDTQFHRYRRLVLAYQRRRMIAAGVKPYRAKRLGKRYGDKERGRFMGMSGWIPGEVSYTLMVESLGGLAPGQYEWES